MLLGCSAEIEALGCAGYLLWSSLGYTQLQITGLILKIKGWGLGSCLDCGVGILGPLGLWGWGFGDPLGLWGRALGPLGAEGPGRRVPSGCGVGVLSPFGLRA